MDKKVITKEIDLGGRKLKLETGKLALQADSSVVATYGETVVLVTVAFKETVEDMGYFPLSVEYVEKYYAGGRITSQKFIKRETRPSEKAVLSGRAIDRSIRPLFPKDFKHEVQVIVTVLSYDGTHDPVFAGFVGTSAALSISTLPFHGPLGISRIGIKKGETLINPDVADFEHLDLDLVVAATREKIVMIEAEGKQTPDDVMFEMIKKAHEESQVIIDLVEEFTKEAGKEKLVVVPIAEQISEPIMDEVKKEVKVRTEEALLDTIHPWHEATGDVIKSELSAKYNENLTPIQIAAIFDKVAKEIMNDTVLKEGKRVDGRAMNEVRPISMETGILPRTHGSAVFTRGGTQVLSIATLGPLSVSQTLEGMEGEATKKFMHHYNMGINPFSTGEVKRIGSPSRRDIGHGNLVEKSIVNVLPDDEEFPYAIRVVSEVLGANASTSQASVCATSLALLNAGVPIEPVAGIAMGLLSNGGVPSSKSSSGQAFQVITDMQATEDFYGEMDFKVAGTVNGITGIQMDTKLTGLTFEIIEKALKQGKEARETILAKMKEIAPKAEEVSEYAPKIEVTHIKPEEIGMLIGPGGKNINAIIARTGAQIDIEDDGTVMVSSTDQDAINKALSEIEGMFKKVEVGEEFDGKVVRIAPFGAFVEIAPGKDGLVHVSQMASGHVERPEDVVSEGQVVHVRVTNVDPMGKIGLSMLFGADIKPDSEGRPRSGGFRPSSESGGYRPSSSGGSRSGGFSRDRGGSRGGFGGRKDPSSGGFRTSFGRDKDRRGSGSRGGRGGFGR